MHHVEKSFQRMDFGVGFVPMPLEVPAHPEDPPSIPRSYKAGLCNRRLHLLRLVLPVRPDFEDLDTLTADAVADVQLVANVLGWAAVFEELRERLLAPLKFKLRESHGAGATGSA